VSARDESKRKDLPDPPEEQLVRAWATASWRTYWRTRERYLANRPFLTELQSRKGRCDPPVGRFDSYAAPFTNCLHIGPSDGRAVDLKGNGGPNLVPILVPVCPRLVRRPVHEVSSRRPSGGVTRLP
jgi:hypothetical protein